MQMHVHRYGNFYYGPPYAHPQISKSGLWPPRVDHYKRVVSLSGIFQETPPVPGVVHTGAGVNTSSSIPRSQDMINLAGMWSYSSSKRAGVDGSLSESGTPERTRKRKRMASWHQDPWGQR